jgi:putative acetyltransferase
MTTVREVRDGDRRAIATLHEASIRTLGPEAYTEEQVEAWASGKDPEGYPIGEAGSYLVVAEREGSVAGFGHLVVRDREVTAVYVDPDHACQGVGTAILDELESEARDRGLDDLSLVASLNAVGFYERRGWERGEDVVHETSGGIELECVAMDRSLD